MRQQTSDDLVQDLDGDWLTLFSRSGTCKTWAGLTVSRSLGGYANGCWPPLTSLALSVGSVADELGYVALNDLPEHSETSR